MDLDKPVESRHLSPQIARTVGLVLLVIGGVLIVVGMNLFFVYPPSPGPAAMAIIMGLAVIGLGVAIDSKSHGQPRLEKKQEPLLED